jgi:uncharacterized protein
MPSADRPVVVDATPIVALAGLGHLNLFQRLYGEVLVPPAVWSELTRGGLRPGGLEDLDAAPWIQEGALAYPDQADFFPDLDRGEAEVIAIAQQTGARLVILDDRSVFSAPRTRGSPSRRGRASRGRLARRGAPLPPA